MRDYRLATCRDSRRVLRIAKPDHSGVPATKSAAMILECTECHTRYLVPDTAIGPEGRMVRCAQCKNSWFQPPAETLDLTAAAPPAQPMARPAPVPPVVTPPAADNTDYDAFAHRPPFRPRRNPAKRWTVAAIAAGVAMLVAAGAILYSGAPGLATQFGLPIGVRESPLRFDGKKIDRRDLASGNELFAVSGQVVNPTNGAQHVPDIRAELRDAQGRLVYSWTFSPQQRVIAPGARLDFNSAKLDVPSNSRTLELSFAGEIAG
jgi:predicted Zn finger-like uncharacterized protein